jgi:hypothetical protein
MHCLAHVLPLVGLLPAVEEGSRFGLPEARPAAHPAADRHGLQLHAYLPVPLGKPVTDRGACGQQALADVASSEVWGCVGCGGVICRIRCDLCRVARCVRRQGHGCEGLVGLLGWLAL